MDSTRTTRTIILTGDCRKVLPMLRAESISCCVTSPPYIGLRDYGTGMWEGGKEGCPHATFPGAATGNKGNVTSVPERGVCRLCGAVRVDRQIGLERSLEEYVTALVEVFREVRRVLRNDGTLWLVLGDAYNAYNGNRGTNSLYAGDRERVGEAKFPKGHGLMESTLKQKDLLGIPWRVAFALQADGWYLRAENIWQKPNCMTTSATDRTTRSHETVFMLAKERRYYYDADVVREPATGRSSGNKRAKAGEEYGRPGQHVRQSIPYVGRPTRNRRSVWTIKTEPYKEGHHATFPAALVEPCILAGSPKGGVVLDPFGGVGTTGLAARRLGRSAVLIELNPEYVKLATKRCEGCAGEENGDG